MESFATTYIKTIHSMLKNRRILFLIGSITGIFSFLSLFSEQFLFSLSKAFNLNMEMAPFPLMAIAISVFSFALLYLQSGQSSDSDEVNKELKYRIDQEFISQRKSLENHFNEIESLKKKLESINSEKGFSEAERIKVMNDAIGHLSEDSVRSIFNVEASNYKKELSKSLGYEKLQGSIKDVKSRLQREIADLRLRSNINLLLGMAITAGGLYLLWTTVSMVDASQLLKELASEGTESNSKFLKNLLLPLIPRVMLVIFVEVFAYFFLRLYKAGLDEIKYFQNELTNIESKLVALEFAFVTENETAMASVIESLASTERNFVLEKNQTTVELEKAKSDTQLTQTLIKAVPNLFKKN